MIVYDVRDLVKVYPGQTCPANRKVTMYAASALRQALLGPVTWQIALDLFALIGFAAVSFWVAGRAMDWRQR